MKVEDPSRELKEKVEGAILLTPVTSCSFSTSMIQHKFLRASPL